MKDYVVIGYAESGEIYCLDCIGGDTEEACSIFAGDESEYTCSDCGEEL